jgi:hypothetical protein
MKHVSEWFKKNKIYDSSDLYGLQFEMDLRPILDNIDRNINIIPVDDKKLSAFIENFKNNIITKYKEILREIESDESFGGYHKNIPSFHSRIPLKPNKKRPNSPKKSIRTSITRSKKYGGAADDIINVFTYFEFLYSFKTLLHYYLLSNLYILDIQEQKSIIDPIFLERYRSYVTTLEQPDGLSTDLFDFWIEPSIVTINTYMNTLRANLLFHTDNSSHDNEKKKLKLTDTAKNGKEW